MPNIHETYNPFGSAHSAEYSFLCTYVVVRVVCGCVHVSSPPKMVVVAVSLGWVNDNAPFSSVVLCAWSNFMISEICEAVKFHTKCVMYGYCMCSCQQKGSVVMVLYLLALALLPEFGFCSYLVHTGCNVVATRVHVPQIMSSVICGCGVAMSLHTHTHTQH